MTKYLTAFFILAFLVVSCAPATVSTTQLPTTTVSPTITPSPTPSATPTTTPYPSLQTQGPYILFTRDNKNLTLMDADGGGRKQIQVPNDGYTFQLNRSVSPDGKWLAYFTGSTEEPYDIALNLLNLFDETTQPVTNLLASDFPANLEPIIETMALGDPPNYDADCFQDMECRWSLVQNELTSSLFSFDWSPDSQFIAFTAQIDGPSSDIYIHTLQEKTIHQLTDEPDNIYWIDWAPNGERILYEICSTPGTAYEGRTLHVTDLEGKTTFINKENLYNRRWGEYDWLTESLYLFDHPNDTDKPPIYDLIIIDTDTGQLKEIWPYSVESFAINKENKTIVLLHRNHNNQRAKIQEGIYIVYPSGKYWKISDVGIQSGLIEGQKPYPIFVQDYEQRIYNIRNDGSIELLEWADHGIPWISPDGKLLLFRESKNLVLYNDSNEFLKSWPMENGNYNVTWSPDALGVFIFTDTNVYYLAIFAEQPHPLMENCPLDGCEPARFVWIP
jgi:Periplasmic component of the Tol biopolymer transport system